ncbi:ribonuclease R [Motiliproteus sediminis]|uniref:ribonuclease R n=1 Tax=Motiliproteus sediminis TaxID=1468178 RepID=UPI001AF00ED8|nr:ribonuclease R [Motiliproteus sediminis]
MSRDPHADREARNYDNPIPSREFILDLLRERGKPLKREQLAAELKLFDDEQQEALRRRLRAMERDGQVIRDRKGGYGLVTHMDLIAGRVIGHRDGYGFLVRDEGGDDLFLHNRQMRKVFDGDRVLVRISGLDHRGREEAKIVEVLERNTKQLVGRLRVDQGICILLPENNRISNEILIADDDRRGAEDGQYVLAEITQYADRVSMIRARVVEVLGDHMAPGMEIDVAIRNHDIPHVWPTAVTQAASKLGAEVAEADKANRIDLRNTPLVTIDGEDARDFDDAVYAEARKGGGWRLFVAIADVSHYVTPGSALDQEAENRATSVYFPGQVVPMLPEALSNGLCSLNPDVDRLAMVCEMTISARGNLSSYCFYEAVIRSHARLTYTQVGALLEEPESETGQQLIGDHEALVPHLIELHSLYKALRRARYERGAIDFETTETKIQFGQERKIERIVPVVRNDAHKLIEECMLCANVATARFLQKLKIPALYRVHEGPKAKKLESLRTFLGELGLDLGGGDKPTPAHYDKLLSSIGERPDAHVVQTMMLRSLSQAVYTPDNQGHFGLSYPAYAHFTSPIRRYPDLLVHRAIRSVIHSPESGGLLTRAMKSVTGRGSDPVRRLKGAPVQEPAKSYPYDMAAMVALGEHCSMAERRADAASWDVQAWLKCEYMQDCIGNEFVGVVNGVTNFGLFVELKDIYVEGLIHVTALAGDYYHFDAAKQRLTGERTRVSYRLGDELLVKVVRVDLDERKIDFELVDKLSGRNKGKGGARAKTGKSSGEWQNPAKKSSSSRSGKSGSTRDKLRQGKVGSKPAGGAGKKPADGKPAGKAPAKSGGGSRRKRSR